MRYKFLLIVICFAMMVPASILAQANQQLGVHFSPTGSYRYLDASNSPISSEPFDDEPRLGFSAGLHYAIDLSPRITVQAGLQFTDRGFRNYDEGGASDFSDQLSPAYGFNYANDALLSYEFLKIVHHYQYLDVPFRFQYKFSNKEWHFYGFAGVSANVFLNHTRRRVIKYDDGERDVKRTSGTAADMKTLNIQGLIGGGVGYHFNDHISVAAEPFYRRSLTSFNDDPVKGYFWSGGLQISGNYHF